MLYWADRGDAAKIERSWLDGQERTVLVADGLGWPTGLSIDFTNGDRIYWSDSKESRIESVLPSGGDRRTAVYIGEGWAKRRERLIPLGIGGISSNGAPFNSLPFVS